MRIEFAISLAFVLVSMAVIPAAAQNAAGERPMITGVSVSEGTDVVDVEISFSELVQPEVKRLEHPDRLVFNFPGCELADLGKRFVVDQGSVHTVSTESSGIRSGARVVVELGAVQDRGQATDAKASAAKKLVVSLS